MFVDNASESQVLENGDEDGLCGVGRVGREFNPHLVANKRPYFSQVFKDFRAELFPFLWCVLAKVDD